MTFPSWLRGLTHGSVSTLKEFRRSRGQRPPATRRLVLEALEDRLCLSYTTIDLGTLGGTYSDASA